MKLGSTMAAFETAIFRFAKIYPLPRIIEIKNKDLTQQQWTLV